MIFKDPIQTIQVELPAGWSYDSFNSSLTDLVFTRWDRQEVILIVHVRRASIDASQTDEQWMDRIRTEMGNYDSLIDLASNHGRAVAATFTPNRGRSQRVAFIRGPRVELVIEQRGSETGADNPWAPLEKVVLTASSDANRELKENLGQAEFNQYIEKANAAMAEEDVPAVMDALQEAIRVGVYSWLRSLSSSDNMPAIYAAVRAAQTLFQLGRFTRNPYLPRDAEYVLRRALRSLQDADSMAETSGELGKEISETLNGIMSEWVEQSDSGSAEPLSPIAATRERAFRLAEAAAKSFDTQDFENASILAEAAVDGFLSLISFWRQSRSQEIPEEIMAQLASQGITDLESQRDAIQNAREAALLPPLNTVLQIQYCCALEKKNQNDALEATTVLVAVAQLVFKTNPEDAGAAFNLALALMDGTGALVLSPDKDKLDLAAHCLDEANQVLDALGDRGRMNDAWLRYHKGQIEGTLQAVAYAMESTARKDDSGLHSGLKPIQSQYESLATRFGEMLAKHSNPQ
jgi:hypothetical protein